MKTFSLFLPIGFIWALLHLIPQAPVDPLSAVLKTMDTAAVSFRSTQAEFEWNTYEKVIDEVDDVQTGTIYYRRTGKEKEIEMMADVRMEGNNLKTLKPEPKYVLFGEGKVRMYQPKVDQVTEFDLGFGGSGQDLVKAFDVTYVGPEKIDGVATAKLQLVPKSEKARNTYNRIFLWIDLDRGISVQQQFFTPQQDYRLAKYSSIQVNGKKIPDEVFKLKTTGKTQTISPRG
jgi:outer membrane lipoprotein-sorting protein